MAKQYHLLISKSVAKDLQDLQPKQYKQVVAKILLLGTKPLQQDCKLSRELRVVIVPTKVSLESCIIFRKR